MSKQTDEEQIFGRLDLSSLIPGNMPQSELMCEKPYADFAMELEGLYGKYKLDGQMSTLKAAAETAQRMEYMKRIICATKGGTPKIITDGKIPDSHIVFLDEIFKSNDGILNSLLTALNERVYTNEGQTVRIPVISFFSASNEIPNYNDSTQAILKPLYDRFELKVLTKYVEDRDNRIAVLKAKQSSAANEIKNSISIQELGKMQEEVQSISVPDSIFELMDDVLCELRRCGVHVSDRKFFGFIPIVQAKAYLGGNTEVISKDLLILKNYFWNTPEEIAKVEKILSDLCENPIGAKTQQLLDMARESAAELENEDVNSESYMKMYIKYSKELLRIYIELTDLKNDDIGDTDTKTIDMAAEELERMSIDADNKVAIAHIPLSDKKRLNV